MAKFSISIQSHQKRLSDGKYPVSIRIFHNGKNSFLNTGYYVTSKQVTVKFKLKDTHLLSQIYNKIEEYGEIIGKINTDHLTAKEIAEYISDTTKRKDGLIDFVEFSRKHIEKIKPKQPSRARRLNTSINALIDYFHREFIAASELTSKVLTEFEKYLLTDRQITRTIGGVTRPRNRPAMSLRSARDFLGDIRTLFNECRKEYNDEEKDIILVKNDPFLKYKFPKVIDPEKRSLESDIVKKIFALKDFSVFGHSGNTERGIMSRDVWIISFLLIGANTADLYYMDDHKNGRITYKRKKTTDRRKDEALISVKIEPELLPYLKKYKDKERVFSFHRLYADFMTFNSAVNKGLKYVSERIGVKKISSYSARHSWATIARNECEISKDDIHLCLNHVDKELKITDTYIKKDWGKIDKANRKVIDYIVKPKSK